MHELSVTNIRRTDKWDRLEASGVSWTEIRPRTQFVCLTIIAVAVYFAICGIIFVGATGSSLGTAIAVLFGFIAVMALAVYAECGGRRRSVVFQSDGQVHAPERLPFTFFRDWGTLHHGSIVSIEASPFTGMESYVIMYMDNGDAIAIARGLEPAHARKVTVLLNKALQDLRDDGARRARAAAAGPARVIA